MRGTMMHEDVDAVVKVYVYNKGRWMGIGMNEANQDVRRVGIDRTMYTRSVMS